MITVIIGIKCAFKYKEVISNGKKKNFHGW